MDLRERAGDDQAVADTGTRAVRMARRAIIAQAGVDARRMVLEQLTGLASRTALALVHLGRFDEAVATLESGRAVLFGDQVRLARRTAVEPGIADELPAALRLVSSSDPGTPQARLHALASLAEDRPEDEASAAARDVADASRLRPLLYLAAGRQDGAALLVCDGQVQVSACPSLMRETARDTLMQPAAILDQLRAPDRSMTDLDRALVELVANLRSALPGPLHEQIIRLGSVAVVAMDELAGVPVHLIADPEDAAISILLSAGTLLWNAREPHDRRLEPHVVCAITRGPDAAPAAGAERDSALARGGDVVDLGDERATRQAVLDAVATAGCLQLICHGQSKPWDPLASAVAMWDGPLRAADLLGVPAGRGRLAVLTACESAMTELAFPDEAAGLPSAFCKPASAPSS